MTHTIDAKGKTIGRVASSVATILMGKHTADFENNKVGTDSVAIVNASKARITPVKALTKTYTRYSGYPGGLTTETLKDLSARKSKGFSEVFRLAVYGMLPANKLRPLRMKKLTISE